MFGVHFLGNTARATLVCALALAGACAASTGRSSDVPADEMPATDAGTSVPAPDSSPAPAEPSHPDTSTPVTPDAPTTPAPEPEPLTFCSAAQDFANTCAVASQCAAAMASDCNALTGLVSETLLDQAAECVASGRDPFRCAKAGIADLEPRDSHRALAATFCSSCVANIVDAPYLPVASLCEDAIVGTGVLSLIPERYRTQIEAVRGLLFALGDDVVASISDQCTTGDTCLSDFPQCAQRVLMQQEVPQELASCFVEQLTHPDAAAILDCATEVASSSSSEPAGGYRLVVVGGTMPSSKANGDGWDIAGGLPDPMVIVTAGASSNETHKASNTLNPAWNETTVTGLRNGDLAQVIRFDVIDVDTAFDDPIGQCTLAVGAAVADGSLTTTTHSPVCEPAGLSLVVEFDGTL